MYTRAQGVSPIARQSTPEKPERVENAEKTEKQQNTATPNLTDQKAQESTSKNTESSETVAPAGAKTPRYRAARRKNTNTEPPQEIGQKNQPESECEKESETPDDRTRNCENCENGRPEQPCQSKTEPPAQPPPFCQNESPPHEPKNDTPPCSNPKKSGLLSLVDGFSTDDILILALIILLIMQGSDDILVLALCFILL